MSTLLDRVAEQLGWPVPEAIWGPRGAGAAILVEMAQRKIGRALTDGTPGAGEVRVGVLTGNPASDDTEAPLAIVCEFGQNVSENVLQTLHTLAWNFARSPLLITLEPTRVRSWSCFEAPRRTSGAGGDSRHAEIEAASGAVSADGALVGAAVRALDWVSLASGEFFRTYESHFPRERRADQTLLDNLRAVRSRLVEPAGEDEALSADVAHDLLARLIFIQFLFQRRDSSGTPALTPAVLHRLHRDGVLRREHDSLEALLRSHRDSYAFFRWLNTIFNGDLFPAKSEVESERDREWAAEERVVRASHLQLLADFVSGSLVLEREQLSLWPLYSFDVIPLEFISSVYEEFVHHGGDADHDVRGTHYTPLHLVDFVLDAILPWDSDEWDLKILDPSCGSGVFLVKAYQRLVHRWKRAHPGERVTAEVLRRLLEQNLVGIDVDPHAVRVASFSLYLAMCDEIDPRDYWKRVRFPVLRGRRLLANDFFQEDVEGIRSDEDAGRFDLIVGNAPWGHTSASEKARNWADGYAWSIPNKDVGPLFLAKSARLARPGAHVALLQSVGLLMSRYGPASAFREKLFSTYKVDEVVNFSALRRRLFAESESPTCCVILRNAPPDGEPLRYVCPKPTRTGEDQFRIVIDAHDVHDVYPEEAATDPRVWAVFMWGGRRDYALLDDLRRFPTLRALRDRKVLFAAQGVQWGDRKVESPRDMGRWRLLDRPTFPEDTFIQLDPTQFEMINAFRHDSRAPVDFRIFRTPQLIIKQSWKKGDRRLRTALVTADKGGRGVLCTQSYVSVSAEPGHEGTLAAAFLGFSSSLSVYQLLMTSGRVAAYRPEALVGEILDLPLPPVPATGQAAGLLDGLRSWDDVEERAQAAYGLPPAHRALVEDVVRYTLPNFKEDASAPGWRPTQRRTEDDRPACEEPELRAYCDYFLRVLRAAFATRDVCATVYHDAEGDRLPVRLVAIHLDWPGHDEDVRITPLASRALRERLLALDAKFLRERTRGGGSIFYQRVARVYDTVKIGRRKVPTVFLVKPDRARYWTRSMAMRDADEVVAESGVWQCSVAAPPEEKGRA